MLLRNGSSRRNSLSLSYFLLLGLFLLPATLTYGSTLTKTYGFSENHKNYFVDQSLNSRQTLQTAAQQHTEQNAFHLFSHGRPGELLINGQWLDAKQIAQWLTNEQRIKSTAQQLNSSTAQHLRLQLRQRRKRPGGSGLFRKSTGHFYCRFR